MFYNKCNDVFTVVSSNVKQHSLENKVTPLICIDVFLLAIFSAKQPDLPDVNLWKPGCTDTNLPAD